MKPYEIEALCKHQEDPEGTERIAAQCRAQDERLLAQLGARVVEIINNRPPKCVKSPWPEGYPDYALRLVTDAARALGLLGEDKRP